LSATPIADTLGALNDLVDAGAGSDIVRGGIGDDTLQGGVGADSLFGEAGADQLNSRDAFSDRVDGGDGSDTADRDALDRLISVEAVNV